MKILVDGKQRDIIIEPWQTLGEAINSLKQIVADENKVIKNITVDDVSFPELSEADLGKKRISEINKLEVITDTPAKLAIEPLTRAKDYLENLKTQIEKFSQVLQTGGQEESYDTFIEDLKGWQTVIQLLDIVGGILKIDLGSMMVHGWTVKEMINELQEVLSQVKTAFQNEDVVYLQDLLQYELISSVDKMRAVVIEMTRMVQERSK